MAAAGCGRRGYLQATAVTVIWMCCKSAPTSSAAGKWKGGCPVSQCSCMPMQVQTSDGNDYNVGTMIDTFVYNTIAQWYNDDGGDNGNKTLPLTPTAGTPGSGSSNSQNGLKNLKISTPWVIAVIAAGGGLLLVAIVVRPPAREAECLQLMCCCSQHAANTGLHSGPC